MQSSACSTAAVHPRKTCSSFAEPRRKGSSSSHLLFHWCFYLSSFFILASCVGLASAQNAAATRDERRAQVYLNQFAVQIDDSSVNPSELARKHGFINNGKVGVLENWYLFSDPRIRKRQAETKNRQTRRIRSLKQEVKSIERLWLLSRVKRDQQVIPPVDTIREPNDPSWNQMWYMHCDDEISINEIDYGTEQLCHSSMRVTDAWKAGYHGQGVVITILDDGIESSHPDLNANYDAAASIDINDRDSDPRPRYDPSNENKHGTRCAGVVAAVLDNHICSVGVAYEAKIGGIRMLDGDVTDAVEAQALNHAYHYIGIYSASWGPDDDGKTVEGPGPLAQQALSDGAALGRNGKGSIFVWASGNGGSNQDSCACDGYINSIYTIGISSVSQLGNRPWYLEACASTIATTYSSGEAEEGKVVTTDLHSSCTSQHTGTSASAPMAAGLIALMLEANPELTWRDVQHIIIRTSKAQGLKANDWVLNGAGYNVSHVFGFGLMDAAAMTHVAKSWEEVPDQRTCTTSMIGRVRDIMGKSTFTERLETDACYREVNQVSYLEHVILRISLRHSKRGDLQIYLTSPAGTRSKILEKRTFDRSRDGFNRWEFMTTHHWGENPMGTWLLEIEDTGFKRSVYTSNGFIRGNGVLYEWQLTFYGSTTHPQPGFTFDNCDAFPQALCHPECVGCCGSGDDNCKQCRNVKTLRGSCVAACESNQYVDSVTNICMTCSNACATCYEGGAENCLSCPTGYRLSEGRCLLVCPDGYYVNPSTRTCRKCNDHCATCEGRRNNCLSCEEGYRLRNGRCEANCQKGYYMMSNRAGCRPCAPGCEECRSVNRCVLCQEGHFLFHGRRCQRSCGARYYAEEEQRRCRPCFPKCATCEGRRPEQCTSCYSKHRLEGGRCVSKTEKQCVDVENKHPERCRYVLMSGRCQYTQWWFQCCATCSSAEPRKRARPSSHANGNHSSRAPTG